MSDDEENIAEGIATLMDDLIRIAGETPERKTSGVGASLPDDTDMTGEEFEERMSRGTPAQIAWPRNGQAHATAAEDGVLVTVGYSYALLVAAVRISPESAENLEAELAEIREQRDG